MSVKAKWLKMFAVFALATLVCISTKPTSVTAEPKTLTLDLGDGVSLELVSIPEGMFIMGSDHGRFDEKPVHEVIISKPFFMGKYEVTQEQYEKVMGKNPSKFNSSKNPVEQVSWDDAQGFCKKLSQTTGYTISLPTEAQWEYACRAGSKMKWYFGDDESQLGEYAWYDKNAGQKTNLVGQKKPNAWGLYDMYGNVYEWCQDWFDFYSGGTQTDPTGPTDGLGCRVFRGGCWCTDAFASRSAWRNSSIPGGRYGYMGFRIVAISRN